MEIQNSQQIPRQQPTVALSKPNDDKRKEHVLEKTKEVLVEIENWQHPPPVPARRRMIAPETTVFSIFLFKSVLFYSKLPVSPAIPSNAQGRAGRAVSPLTNPTRSHNENYSSRAEATKCRTKACTSQIDKGTG